MRILGVDLPRPSTDEVSPVGNTLVLLDDGGRVARAEHPTSAADVATAVARLVGGDPFLLGVNAPVVVPPRQARARPVEGLIRRRFGVRLPAGGRAAQGAESGGIRGEALLAGLAAAGQPCLPYPDRDRRRSGLAETHAAAVLKALLWQDSLLASAPDQPTREELFRAFAPPAYRATGARARASWSDQAAALDLVLRALASPNGYDTQPAREALTRSASKTDVERAGGLLDAALIAGTARRYLDSPESCIFLGDQEGGYVILPADGFLRRLALRDRRAPRGRLFPEASLRDRLAPHAQFRSTDLLNVPGRPARIEAGFEDPPRYEFDNVDEMLWWKHCRHLSGPRLPTEGLSEMIVALGDASQAGESKLKLVRSRHRTLSFRFDSPGAWRTRVPTRDGKTYPFKVLRAIYDTAD